MSCETGLPARLASMLNAFRTGRKGARVGHAPNPATYGARKGSAWADWYQWGYDGLPVPQELAARGIGE